MKSGLFRPSACGLALLLVAGCGAKEGSAPVDASASFTAAADALSAKLKAGAPPASDPAVRNFDSEAAKALKTLGTPALPLRGFDSYEDLCGKTATIVGAYVNFGVDQASEASRAELMNRNATQYLDQMFTPLLFSAHCSAAHMPFLEKEAGDQVASKAAALQQVRSGAYGQAGGLLEMAGSGDLDAARKQRIVDLLAADAANFAVVLSPAQRQALANGAESARASLPETARGQVDRIKAGFAAAPCGALCKM
jgi:hypothetical protein